MTAVVGIAWIVYSIIIAGLFAFSIGFTRYYQHKHESETFATVVTILALTLVLATVVLVPVDIYLVSSTVDPATGLKHNWAVPETVEFITFTVQIAYYICYGLIAAFSFFIIPFAYFFYEEYDDEDEQSLGERIGSALKYTSFFVVVCVLLITMGIFIKPSQDQPKLDLDWFKKLLSGSNGERSLSFVLACLLVLGMLVFIFYAAPGLSLLPFNMIKGRRGLESERNDLDSKLTVNRERQREIRARYGGVSKIMNGRDQGELDRLEDEARVLSRQLKSIDERNGGRWQRISGLFRPLEFIIGIALLTFSLALGASIFLTIVDKIINTSLCGRNCGYVINHPELFNPVNFIFVKLAKVFPLDYLFMVLLIIYFFLVTLTGIITLGVRFFWITLFRIRRGATMPQGLLILTVLLTLGLLAVNYSLTSVVAPGYAHFGSQVYCNHTVEAVRDCSSHREAIVPCDIYAPTDICTPTITSTLIDRIVISTPFFGIVYYYAQWAFLVVFLIGFVVGLFRQPRKNTDVETEDVDADDEHDPLLQSTSTLRVRPSSYLAAS